MGQLGIATHPDHYRSLTFQRWQSLAQANAVDALQADVLGFLRGTDAIQTYADLDGPWPQLIEGFLLHGPGISEEAALRLLEGKREKLLDRKGRLDGPARLNLADTMLALALRRSLGHPENIDYQAALRVMTLVESGANAQGKFTAQAIAQHLAKPVHLPAQMFRLDPCSGARANQPFAHLQLATRPATAQWMDPATAARPEDEATPGAPADPGDAQPRSKAAGGAKPPCVCLENPACLPQSKCCATLTPYVVDLHIVREHTKCYRPGDLSYIKNVLASETLSTIHRRLERLEEVVETEETRTEYAEKDLQTEDKSQLKTEIDSTIKTDLAFSSGMTATWGWGTATADMSASHSKETSNKLARDYSRDVIERSVTRLEEKLRTMRRATHLLETEETNEHSFVNTDGPNISGQYLYVDKLSRAQVYNYGRKLTLDLYLPEPAALFIKLLQGKFDGVAPTEPPPLAITPKDIPLENYDAFLASYGIWDVDPPPAPFVRVEVQVEGSTDAKDGAFYTSVTIPDGYLGVSLAMPMTNPTYKNTILYDRGFDVNLAGGHIGSKVNAGSNNVHWNPEPPTTSLPGIEGTHTLSVDTLRVKSFSWLMTIDCNLKPARKLQWQKEVFAKLQEAQAKLVEKYEKELAKFEEAKRNFELEEEMLRQRRYNRNPHDLRLIERAELKRMAISYITCQFNDQFHAMLDRVQPCGYPLMDIRRAEREGRFIQFFEQAFNWNLMSYIFYPYLWSRAWTWPDKLKEEANDPGFRQFLTAGSARVLLPIRDGFHDLVNYFLTTGEIWGQTGTPPTPGDPYYVSLAQELKEQKDNYYADRDGTLTVTKGSRTVILDGTEWYHDANSAAATDMDELLRTADLNREIIIDCQAYRIVDIQPNPAGGAPQSWEITLERPYEGADALGVMWATGAVFIGAPWEFTTPTTLVFLRDKAACLPCYPLKECKEQ